MSPAGDNPGAGRYAEFSDDDEEKRSGEASGGLDPGALPRKSPSKKGGDRSSFAMKEVLHQLGSLTCAVERLAEDSKVLRESQTRCQSDIDTIRATSRGDIRPLPAVMSAAVPVPSLLGAIVANPPGQVPSLLGPGEASQGASQSVPAVPLPNPNQDPPVPLSNGARVSRKTHSAAISGEFVNLAEFAPNTEPSSIMESVLDESTGQLVFKAKKLNDPFTII